MATDVTERPEQTGTDPDDKRGSSQADSATDSRAVAPSTLLGYLAMPAFIAAVLVGLYLYVEGQRPLGNVAARNINTETIQRLLVEHIQLTLASTVVVLAIAIPLGIALTRPRVRQTGVTPVMLGVTNVGQATPSIGLLVLLGVLFIVYFPETGAALGIGFGFRTAVIGLAAYTLVPVLRNTMVGLEQVDRFVIDSARGMGMSEGMVLRRIELPLAVPVMMAGVRTALVINVGTAALATFINGGGLGDMINTGIALRRLDVLIVGAVLTAALALAIDWVAGIAEDVLRPRGLKARAG